MQTKEAPTQNRKKFSNTQDTRLAAALIAMGIPLLRGEAPLHVRDAKGEEKVTWFFEERDATGTIETQKLIDAWNDPEWFRKNCENEAFAYCKAATINHMRLLDFLKNNKPFVQLKKGKSLVLAQEGNQLYRDALDDGYEII